jgi:hypothetical protein
MANLVVKRTAALEDPRDRQLVWWIQLVSHEDGGLLKLSRGLAEAFPDRIATRTMQKAGTRTGQIYGSECVKLIRREIAESSTEMPEYLPRFDVTERWPLFGEGAIAKPSEPYNTYDGSDDVMINMVGEELKGRWHEYHRAKQWARTFPKSYPAAEFCQFCKEHLRKLPTLLAVMCLDPAIALSDFRPFFFPDLVQSLRDYMQRWIDERTRGHVTTVIGRRVSDALDYTAEQRIMSLINGAARIGKSFEARKWCDAHAGTARYIQVPSSNDEVGFYRAIARALGVSINLNSKAHHLRDRIEDVLQSGQLMPVFDEAHFLWPTSNYRGALPRRVNWINNALVNHGVPVALITTPQFFLAHSATVDKSHWNSDQFDGRLLHYEALPDSLSREDLSAVAKSLLPEGDTSSIRGLVAYAQSSVKYLAGIVAAVTRARYLAKRDGRTKVTTDDVRRALNESVIPSNKALAEAVEKAMGKTRPRRGAPKLTTPFESELTTAQEPLNGDSAPENFTSPRLVAARETHPATSGREPVTLDA